MEVDDADRTVLTADGERSAYDALLVAVGAESRAVFDAATTWMPERDPEVFGGLLRDDEGYTKRLAFVVPPGAYWPLPAYELALMTAWQAWGMGQNDVEITVYTHEEAPLAAFGRDAAVALRRDLAEARVDVQTGVFVEEEEEVGLVVHPQRRAVDAQRIIALPAAAPRDIKGLPRDASGFIPVDLHGKVPGTQSVWAAGDAISFPVKQGGLAAQEADAAAEAIAALAGADLEPRPFHPVLRGVVLTGRGRQWIRSDVESGETDVAHDEGSAERHALWWPPTKIAGRYLSPYLAALAGSDDLAQRPDGQPVELDVERELAGAADALQLARMRSEADESTPARD
jgi:sulfide:quinone oxidoreductase